MLAHVLQNTEYGAPARNCRSFFWNITKAESDTSLQIESIQLYNINVSITIFQLWSQHFCNNYFHVRNLKYKANIYQILSFNTKIFLYECNFSQYFAENCFNNTEKSFWYHEIKLGFAEKPANVHPVNSQKARWDVEAGKAFNWGMPRLPLLWNKARSLSSARHLAWDSMHHWMSCSLRRNPCSQGLHHVVRWSHLRVPRSLVCTGTM